MSDTIESLRARRDACLVHFAIAMFACFGMAAVWEVPGEGWTVLARVAATITFALSLAYAGVAWLYGISAHLRLRQRRDSLH